MCVFPGGLLLNGCGNAFRCLRPTIYFPFGGRGGAKTKNFRFARQQQQMMTDGLSDAMIYFQIMRCCMQCALPHHRIVHNFWQFISKEFDDIYIRVQYFDVIVTVAVIDGATRVSVAATVELLSPSVGLLLLKIDTRQVQVNNLRLIKQPS